MGKRLDGTSLFTGINSGLSNTFAQLSGQYADGITLENLTQSLSNSNIINTQYGATFASYMTNNFSSFDSDGDGKISASEVQALMSQMATQGLTREQIMALSGASGLSTSLQETVLNHFNEIDKNKDGKVTKTIKKNYEYSGMTMRGTHRANIALDIVPADEELDEEPKKTTVSPLELYIRELLAECYQIEENKIEVVIQEAG